MKIFDKKTPYYIISIVVAGLCILLTFKAPFFVDFLEAKTFDIRFLLRGQRDPGPEIVIVGIDDESLKKIGRWPWPRDEFARLLKKVETAGARSVGIDVIFSEPQVTETSKTVKDLKAAYNKLPGKQKSYVNYLEKKEMEGDVDKGLASVIKESGNVILAMPLHVPSIYEKFSKEDAPEIINNYSFTAVKKTSYYRPIVSDKALLPISIFIQSSASLGHVYTQYDRDGAIRWEPLYVEFDGSYYPSFGIEIARNYLKIPKGDLKLIAGEGIILGDLFVPTDTAGRVLINYSGRKGIFPTFSAASVMEGSLPEGALKDKIVLIGTTALGTGDTHVTPFFQIPGIEKQAAVIENMLHSNFLKKEEWTWVLDVIVICITALILGFSLPRLNATAGTALATVFFLSYLTFAQFMFLKFGVWINIVIPLFADVALYSSITAYRFFTEEKKARKIKGIFSSYVTETVVNQLLDHPEMAKLGGDRRDVTILFSDVRGFTTFSETQSPEDVVAILNEYLTAMTEVVFHWQGTLDKFIGDAVMVFWGAPLKQENHAELAVKCAMHMVKRLEELRAKWAAEGKPLLDIGIGLNSGEVLVGNIGAEALKMDYTVIGDHVNLASRVESLTKHYSTRILITEWTFEKVRTLAESGKIGHVSMKGLEKVVVKGKNRPVGLYELSTLDPDSKSVILECDEENVVVMKEK